MLKWECAAMVSNTASMGNSFCITLYFFHHDCAYLPSTLKFLRLLCNGPNIGCVGGRVNDTPGSVPGGDYFQGVCSAELDNKSSSSRLLAATVSWVALLPLNKQRESNDGIYHALPLYDTGPQKFTPHPIYKGEVCLSSPGGL
jgi:hypothetical protein